MIVEGFGEDSMASIRCWLLWATAGVSTIPHTTTTPPKVKASSICCRVNTSKYSRTRILRRQVRGPLGTRVCCVTGGLQRCISCHAFASRDMYLPLLYRHVRGLEKTLDKLAYLLLLAQSNSYSPCNPASGLTHISTDVSGLR